MKVVQALLGVAVVATAVVTASLFLALDAWGVSESWPLAWRAAVALGLGAAASLGMAAPVGARFDAILRRVRDALANEEAVEWHTAPGWLRSFARAIAEAAQRRVESAQRARARARELEVNLRVVELEREHLEGILHSLRDAVLVTDAFNEVQIANEAATALFQVPEGSAARRPVEAVVHDAEIARLIREVRDGGNLAARRVVEREMEAQGERRVFELVMSCLGNQNREVGGVVTILRDVTREKEISQMKTDFVSKASHELRTPLSSIKAYVEMLIDGEAQDDRSRQEFYQIIQNEANRLSRLIDNMLNISRIEAGIFQVEWVEVDLSALIEEVVEVMTPQAAGKKITLNAKRSALPCRAVADRDMMQQVVTNLVSNAVKYTPEGGRVTVSTELTDCDRSVLVTVADTGLGIPPDAIPKLFEKFYRINNYERIAKGTGLGLNLVKQIVETVHGGEVGVDSQLGMGSKFWFIVPCKR